MRFALQCACALPIDGRLKVQVGRVPASTAFCAAPHRKVTEGSAIWISSPQLRSRRIWREMQNGHNGYDYGLGTRIDLKAQLTRHTMLNTENRTRVDIQAHSLPSNHFCVFTKESSLNLNSSSSSCCSKLHHMNQPNRLALLYSQPSHTHTTSHC